MRKNTDGYVLIYVVFVFLFLCIVAAGTCTAALNNLKTQAAYIDQMQDKYEAESNIEQFMAEVCVACAEISGDEYCFTSDTEAIAQAKEDFLLKIASWNDAHCTKTAMGWSAGGLEFVVILEATCGSTKITAEAVFLPSIATPSETTYDELEDTEDTLYSYAITHVTSEYRSYTLESSGGDA